MERTLAGLGKRVFLMHNVHDDAPALFQTRWTLSYLRGPLTREQIRKLTQTVPPAPPRVPAAAPPPRPALPSGIVERFALPTSGGARGALEYQPLLFATASVHYVDPPARLDAWQSIALSAPLSEESAAAPWDALVELPGKPPLGSGPEPGASFAPLPALAQRPRSYARWEKMLETKLFQARPLVLYECEALEAFSNAGESLGDFRVRLRDRMREGRDLALEKLRQKWTPRLAALKDRHRRALERAEREQDDYSNKRLESVVSLGASVLGALFGRKLASAANVGRAASAARSVGRAAREREDIARAEDGAEAIAAQLAEMEAQFQAEAAAIRSGSASVESLEISERRIPLRKGDLSVDSVLLLWTPRSA